MKILIDDIKKANPSFAINKDPVDIGDFIPGKYISGHYSCSFSCSLISGSDLPDNKKLVDYSCGPHGYLLYCEDGSIYHIKEDIQFDTEIQ